MHNRILDISDGGARLRSSLQRLVIERDQQPDVTIPFDDVAVLMVAHPQVSYSQSVLANLSAAGGVFVTCDERRHPVGMLLPLAGHFTQAERFAAQASASQPVRKRLWQQIVRAKIRGQAEVLTQVNGSDHGLLAMVSQVRSGDTTNHEAQAARRYWPHLFGAAFRRIHESSEQLLSDHDSVDCDDEQQPAVEVNDLSLMSLQNRWLNYGYAVLRAMTARAVCASGLHPSLGLHHHNRYNAFCLADDLMEPFRPVVDLAVVRLFEHHADLWELNREAKRELLSALTERCLLGGEQRTLFDTLTRAASSLAAALMDETDVLDLPESLHAAP